MYSVFIMVIHEFFKLDFHLFRIAKAYSCFSQTSEMLLGKCAMFLKVEVVRNYSILASFQKEDFELFKVRNQILVDLMEIFPWTSEVLLGKCAMFLKMELVRNHSILTSFQQEDFELFKVRNQILQYLCVELCP
jgi:hypothetical protein